MPLGDQLNSPTFDEASPAYVPTQLQSISSIDKSGSFRHQNRNLVAPKEQTVGGPRPNMINASAYKKISNQRPSVYRNANGHYEHTISPDEEGETANFGMMMDFQQ